MKKIKFLIKNCFVLMILLSLMNCCTYSNFYKDDSNQEQHMLQKTRLAVVKISVKTIIKIKESTSSSTISEYEESQKSGSGSIIGQKDEGTFILTAGHVCDDMSLNKIKYFFPYFTFEKYDAFYQNYYSVIDNEDNSHPAILIALSKESDTCILLSTTVNNSPLEIEKNNLQYGERVFSINYPQGIWESNYDPIFEGFYMGTLIGRNKNLRNAFSLPTSPGSSGGAIFNKKGNLVSMIHSYIPEFHHITLAASINEINQILEVANVIYDLNKEQILKSLKIMSSQVDSE